MTANRHRHDMKEVRGGIPRTSRPIRLLVTSAIVIAALVVVIPTRVIGSESTPRPAPVASPAASPVATPQATRASGMTRIIVGKITIEISDAGFSPDYFESAVGRDVTITLVNTGTRKHNFTIDRLDVDVDLAPGDTTVVKIDLPKLGEYVFRSTSAGDEHFSGKMVVFI